MDEKIRQPLLYFSFAFAMYLLNLTIQWLNVTVICNWVEQYFGNIELIRKYYLAKEPYNMTEFVGSVAAVGITYIVKFILDKFLVFEKKELELKQTSKEFSLYFIFAIFTTVENVALQFVMTNFVGTPLWLSLATGLTAGYITKFFLDKTFVFPKMEHPPAAPLP